MKKNPSASDMGKVGGRARARSLTAEERQEIARKAVNARWDKVRAEQNGNAAGHELTALSDPGTPAESVQSKVKKAKK